MMTSVWAALRDSGLRNAGTPLEIASTPERTTAPELKARSSTNSAAELISSWFSANSLASSPLPSTSPRSPVNILKNPTPRKSASITR